jgi:hypothetical protein
MFVRQGRSAKTECGYDISQWLQFIQVFPQAHAVGQKLRVLHYQRRIYHYDEPWN